MSIHRTAYLMLLVFLVFIIIAVISGMSFPGDAAFNNWINGIQCGFLDSAMPLVSYLGAFPCCIIASLIIGLICWLLRKRIAALFIAGVPYIGVVISYLLKFLIDRPRPLEDGLANSFPSGHTIYTSILMGSIIYFLPQMVKNKAWCTVLQIIAGLVIAIMIFSRLYLQQHWLSDVLSSLIIGILVIVPAIIVYKYLLKRDSKCLNCLKSKP
ncbi:MAG: phosphatase PAP2 family protein [Dehalococcoidales bacterium]|nr:phosphatase PAP2 family protein [Dehalococcoidales bacterium]